jgi:hypothetical protein
MVRLLYDGRMGALVPSQIQGVRPGDLPRELGVQLPTLVGKAPEGDEWLHEIKVDGYRFTAWVDRTGRTPQVTLRTRRAAEWTAKLPTIAQALAALPARAALLDGEVAVPRADGTTDFYALQNALEPALRRLRPGGWGLPRARRNGADQVGALEQRGHRLLRRLPHQDGEFAREGLDLGSRRRRSAW